jgi:hypothetical protein
VSVFWNNRIIIKTLSVLSNWFL